MEKRRCRFSPNEIARNGIIHQRSRWRSPYPSYPQGNGIESRPWNYSDICRCKTLSAHLSTKIFVKWSIKQMPRGLAFPWQETKGELRRVLFRKMGFPDKVLNKVFHFQWKFELNTSGDLRLNIRRKFVEILLTSCCPFQLPHVEKYIRP